MGRSNGDARWVGRERPNSKVTWRLLQGWDGVDRQAARWFEAMRPTTATPASPADTLGSARPPSTAGVSATIPDAPIAGRRPPRSTPHRVRQPETPPALVARLRTLRELTRRGAKRSCMRCSARKGSALRSRPVGRTQPAKHPGPTAGPTVRAGRRAHAAPGPTPRPATLCAAQGLGLLSAGTRGSRAAGHDAGGGAAGGPPRALYRPRRDQLISRKDVLEAVVVPLPFLSFLL